jgi:predicted RNA-binding Zn ribbon-like protein
MKQSFDFIGGWLCVDFANAFGGTQRDGVGGYAVLLDWSWQANTLPREQARRLQRRASRDADRSAAVAERGIALAAALRRIFTAISDGGGPREQDVSLLNAELSTALGNLAVVPDDDDFALTWSAGGDDLESVLWPVARSAADLLVSADLRRLKSCDSPTCSYLFVDASRPGRRRWCDMKVCGNRQKARRHRSRHRS